eukprot:19579_1
MPLNLTTQNLAILTAICIPIISYLLYKVLPVQRTNTHTDVKHPNIKYEEIHRISAVGLTHIDFLKYQNTNTPVIITDLDLWTTPSHKTGISRLNDIISDNHIFDGIFVTKHKDHRYLYFKPNQSKQQTDDKMYFKSMHWADLYEQFTQQNDQKNEKKVTENVYLYGQPIPDNLYDHHIKRPPFLNNDTLELFVWISKTFTCSHLHFDLNEGFLFQLNGTKQVLLMSSKHHEALYPYPPSSVHLRQSQIDNIHAPDPIQYPLFYEHGVVQYKGAINRNEGLYIPFGWWHQIESVYNEKEDGIVSLSMAWHPYKQTMTQFLKEFVDLMNAKYEECNDLEVASNHAQKVFDQKIKESDLPEFIKDIANIWKQTCVVNA